MNSKTLNAQHLVVPKDLPILASFSPKNKKLVFGGRNVTEAGDAAHSAQRLVEEMREDDMTLSNMLGLASDMLCPHKHQRKL